MMDKELLYRFFEGHASVEEMQKIKNWTELSDENRAMLYRERKLFDTMQVLASRQSDNKMKRMEPRNR